MKKLDWYILWEFVQIITLGAVLVGSTFFATLECQTFLDMVSKYNVPLRTVLTIVALMLPGTVVYALPAAILTGTILVFLRLHRDSEVVALQALGVSFWRIMRPFLVLSLVATIVTFAIGEFVLPQARYLTKRLLLVGMCNSERPFPNRNLFEVKNEDGELARSVVLGKTIGKVNNGFVLFDFTKKDGIDLICAQQAVWKDGAWQLSNGLLLKLLSEHDSGVKGRFGRMQFASQLSRYISTLSAARKNPEKTAMQMRKEMEDLKAAGKKVPDWLKVQYWRRYSQPLACLLLVLAAAPIAFVRSRRETGVALVYGGIVVSSFFGLQQAFLALGYNGVINPVLAPWLPAICLAVFGLGISSVVMQR